jgi:DNA-binding CsgD family transcriptional regulator
MVMGRAANKGQVRALEQVALCLDAFPVLAFLTDTQNRIIWVNRLFARTVGDPMRDNLAPEYRFVPAAVAGPYRERFPRWKLEISRCLASLYQQVDSGNLAESTLALIEQTLSHDHDLRQAAARTGADWDGTMVVKDSAGHMTMVREQVMSIDDAAGNATGFHASLWFPSEADLSTLPSLATGTLSVTSLLTPRQLAIARLYASGLTSENVAADAGISWRTARDHLEEVYDRLDIHSRAELALLLAREGLI